MSTDVQQDAAMTPAEMDRLIEQHLIAENAGDPVGAVAMYTEDVIHDVVGAPTGALHGPEAAQGFYEFLTSNLKAEHMEQTWIRYGSDHCVVEHQWTGAVNGEFLGVPGNGKRVSFRMLHVWDFKDGRIARENVWLDGGSIVAQLTA